MLTIAKAKVTWSFTMVLQVSGTLAGRDWEMCGQELPPRAAEGFCWFSLPVLDPSCVNLYGDWLTHFKRELFHYRFLFPAQYTIGSFSPKASGKNLCFITGSSEGEFPFVHEKVSRGSSCIVASSKQSNPSLNVKVNFQNPCGPPWEEGTHSIFYILSSRPLPIPCPWAQYESVELFLQSVLLWCLIL